MFPTASADIAKKLLIFLAILAICLILLICRTYVARGSISAGTLYWNTNEALLFIAEASDGAQMSYARYALEPFFGSLGHVRQRLVDAELGLTRPDYHLVLNGQPATVVISWERLGISHR
jgi:hypothetical protein